MANQKQFGIWMDGSEAIIVGRESVNEGPFQVLGQVKAEQAPANSNENAANNHKRALEQKFFKEITSYMQNAEVVNVIGTGTAQEQFINFLAETPQFKNTQCQTETANKMNEDSVVAYFQNHFGK